MFRQLFIFGAMLLVAHGAVAQGRIETPRNGTTISGKAIFSGWYCDATEITISIDGAEQLPVAYGTTRGDTVTNCGDSNNGWGLLYNFGGLDDGAHTVVAYADGEQFATSTFDVTKLSTGEFLSDASATATVNDFPSPGNTITLTWEQTLQNFVITNESIPATGEGDVLRDGVAAPQYDAGIFAFDEALGYEACGGGPAPDRECESIAFEVVDDADRGSVLEISYLSDQFAGIVIDSNAPGLDMSAYETGVLKFDIKVVSAGDNTIYKVKLDDHNTGPGTTGEYDVVAENDDSWHTYTVNMSNLLVNVDSQGNGGDLSLSALKAVVFMATYGKTQDVIFRLDEVYFQQ